MFGLNKIIPVDSDYKFLNHRKKFYIASSVAIFLSLMLLFFKGLNWLNRSIQIGKRYLIFGKPQKYGNQISFIHPEMELLKDSSKTSLYNLDK